MADDLFGLLPAIVRERAALERDGQILSPLRDLTAVIQEQLAILDAGIAQLYDDWFIETCRPELVPYLAALVGERLGTPLSSDGLEPRRAVSRARLTVPRRLVANAIQRRRRAGTRIALEATVADVGGWPARAVESYRLLGWTQQLNHLRHDRGRFIDLHDDAGLTRVDGPFDDAAHVVDVRKIDAEPPRTWARFGLPSVAVYAWRMMAMPVTRAPARAVDRESGNVFEFAALGHDVQLFAKASGAVKPRPITRQMLADHGADYYGEARSLSVEIGHDPEDGGATIFEEIPRLEVVVASLRRSDADDEAGWPDLAWRRDVDGQLEDRVAIDPESGRLMFPADLEAPDHVRVSYHYGAPRGIGGGEYPRKPQDPGPHPLLFRVGREERYPGIAAALTAWRSALNQAGDSPRPAVIEITDSGAYTGSVDIVLRRDEVLHLRAADGARPIIRILDEQVDKREALSVSGKGGGCFVLDGLVIEGRGVKLRGDLAQVDIRHSTLVPGWALDHACRPRHAGQPSLVIRSDRTCVTISDSILGPIQVEHDEVKQPPVRLRIQDSIVDASAIDEPAISRVSPGRAHVILDIRRSTVMGTTLAHAIELGEDSIFLGSVNVARRQIGCLRFSWVPVGPMTPSRYRCQPDMVRAGGSGDPFIDSMVGPRFESLRFGRIGYARLDSEAPAEIRQGASDHSEMGAFHDLYETQRIANVRVELAGGTPVAMDAGLIFAT